MVSIRVLVGTAQEHNRVFGHLAGPATFQSVYWSEQLRSGYFKLLRGTDVKVSIRVLVGTAQEPSGQLRARASRGRFQSVYWSEQLRSFADAYEVTPLVAEFQSVYWSEQLRSSFLAVLVPKAEYVSIRVLVGTAQEQFANQRFQQLGVGFQSVYWSEQLRSLGCSLPLASRAACFNPCIGRNSSGAKDILQAALDGAVFQSVYWSEQLRSRHCSPPTRGST